MTEMKNKCSSNSGSSFTDSKKNTGNAPSIVARLHACLENDKIKDLELIGKDGVRVPALRCVLGSASPVLERMLYGEFAEAQRSSIEMGDCSSRVLQALVEFCCSDRLNISLWEDHSIDLDEMMQDLVEVAKLGHTYAVPDLQEAVLSHIMPRLKDDPSLACPVLNASHPIPTPELYAAAIETIQSQPYVALKRNDETNSGGIVCLCPEKLEEVLKDMDIEADELFLFECLVEWREHNEQHFDNIREICDQMIGHFRFTCIDPKDLKSSVLPSGIVSTEKLLDAFMEQAISASNEGLAFAAFRGPRGPEGQQRGHALVQGAGNKGCNGIYTQQQKDISNHPLLYYIKPDKKNGVTYYLIKDRTESWKICENTTPLYEWKAYNQGSHRQHEDFPQTGWSLASSSNGMLSGKVKSPAPTCKFFRSRDGPKPKPVDDVRKHSKRESM